MMTSLCRRPAGTNETSLRPLSKQARPAPPGQRRKGRAVTITPTRDNGASFFHHRNLSPYNAFRHPPLAKQRLPRPLPVRLESIDQSTLQEGK